MTDYQCMTYDLLETAKRKIEEVGGRRCRATVTYLQQDRSVMCKLWDVDTNRCVIHLRAKSYECMARQLDAVIQTIGAIDWEPVRKRRSKGLRK